MPSGPRVVGVLEPAEGDRSPQVPSQGSAVPRPWRVRAIALVVLALCVSVLGLAAYLRPDPRGFGTHQELGFGPCSMILTTGFPCPSCGMTTAFAYTVRGRLGHAFLAQPAGTIFALATIAVALASLWSVGTGRLPVRAPSQRWLHRLFLGFLALLVGGWGFKLLLGLADGSLPIHNVRI